MATDVARSGTGRKDISFAAHSFADTTLRAKNA